MLIFEEALKNDNSKEKIAQAANFEKAILEIHPRLSRSQVSALWQGFQDCTEEDGLGVADFCSIAEAVAIGDDAACEFADMNEDAFARLGTETNGNSGTVPQSEPRRASGTVPQSEPRRASGTLTQPASEMVTPTESREESATRLLQRTARRWRARRQASPGLAMAAVVQVVRKRFSAWAETFDSASNGRGTLDEASLCRAIKEVHPQISDAQVDAMWRSFLENTESSSMDLKTFCAIVEAIAVGDEAAAEFAEMTTEDFVALAER